MRILHIEYGFDYPFPGGEQKRSFEECRRLAQTDELLLAYSSFHTDWRTTKKEFDPKQIPFKTIGININRRIYRPGKWNLIRTLLFPIRRKEAKPIKKIIKNFKPDIVHIHSSGGGIALSYAIYAAKFFNVPIVMMMHNHWPLCASIGYFDFKHKKYCDNEVVCGRCLSDRFKSVVSFFYKNRLVRYVLKNVDHFICYTDFTKSLLIEAGVSSKKVTVISPGIEQIMRREVKSFAHRKFITFSGRISVEKGPDIFLEVAKYYAHRDELQFLFIGDGFFRDEIENRSKRYHLKNITFAGWIDDRERYFDFFGQTKVLIVPSVWAETFGIVILDAFQCGVPVIASKRGGIPLFVEDGKNGFIVEPNTQQIISTLDDIINDSSLWQKMSNACLSFDFKRFNWDSSAEKLRNLYRTIIEHYQ
jgi:glycosyltransferase involved in cell wall biosynthesis